MRTAFLDTRADHARSVWNTYRVKHGIAAPASCEGCGAGGPLEAHHPDYGQPLLVSWVCRPCHRREHSIIELRQTRHPLAQRLAARREMVSEFAARAGVSTDTVRRLFRGDRLTPPTLAKIAAATEAA